MSLIWSDLKCLHDRRDVPKRSGIYMIGILDPCCKSLDPNQKNDPYFGINYPEGFRAKYVGISADKSRGIARRLNEHAKKRGNRQIKQHIIDNGLNTLYYTYSVGDDPHIYEMLYITFKQANFLDWNNKNEKGSTFRKMKESWGLPPDFKTGDWDAREDYF